MSGAVAELENLLEGDALAKSVVRLWDEWYRQLLVKHAQWRETQEYVFATDTSTTANSSLPWRNKTTLPKLCQIRDNLHSNYMAALFPNDDWLKWEAYTLEEDQLDKRAAIQSYMSNKLRESDFQEVISQLIYDYIDYGNPIADVEFINDTHIDPVTGEEIPGYIGPRAIRLSPWDVVFNPTARSFAESPKITRSIKHIGELLKEVEENPDSGYLESGLKRIKDIRSYAGGYSVEDFNKAAAYQVDGFGDLHEYFQSEYVEILEIEGDIYDTDTQQLLKNHIITIADRSTVLRKEPIPSWQRGGTKVKGAWRGRPDNLWAMGPLDNLVGMQYRIDHLENLKADAWDLSVFPMPKIIGEVEEFNFGPGEEIQVIDGDVQFMRPDGTFLNADNQIAILEQKMEEFAGAPREALGIRSPGEKTAFEVNALATAASRIFQEKINAFQTMVLEPLLNNMLEVARRNLDGKDVIRVMDDDIGAETFVTITKEDITAKGKLRPLGAKHFAQQQKLVQDLSGILNSGIAPLVQPHISSKKLTRLIENLFQLDRFELFSDNAAVFEQQETQRLLNQAQEDLQVEQTIGAEDEDIVASGP